MIAKKLIALFDSEIRVILSDIENISYVHYIAS
jgi:hypothetical protein